MSQLAEFDTTSIPDDGLSDEQIEALMQQAQQPPAPAAPQFQAQPAVVPQVPPVQPPPAPVEPVQQQQQVQTTPDPVPPTPVAIPEYQPSTVFADQAAALKKEIEDLTAQAGAAAREYKMEDYAELDAQREAARLKLLDIQTQAALEQQQNLTAAQIAHEQQVAQAYNAVVAEVPALADENSAETQRYNAAFQTMVNNGMLDPNDPLAWKKVHATIISVGGIQPQSSLPQQNPPIASFAPTQGSGAALPSSSLPQVTADDLEKMTDAQLKAYEEDFARRNGMTPAEFMHRHG